RAAGTAPSGRGHVLRSVRSAGAIRCDRLRRAPAGTLSRPPAPTRPSPLPASRLAPAPTRSRLASPPPTQTAGSEGGCTGDQTAVNSQTQHVGQRIPVAVWAAFRAPGP